jgi:hypothetical protein
MVLLAAAEAVAALVAVGTAPEVKPVAVAAEVAVLDQRAVPVGVHRLKPERLQPGARLETMPMNKAALGVILDCPGFKLEPV